MAQITDLNMKTDPETRPYVPWDVIGGFMTDAASRATAATASSPSISTASSPGSRTPSRSTRS